MLFLRWFRWNGVEVGGGGGGGGGISSAANQSRLFSTQTTPSPSPHPMFAVLTEWCPFIFLFSLQIYPYLVVNDACLSDSRREERVLQLLRILNLYFEKRKESSKRHLLFTVPRVVAVSPQMRLIEVCVKNTRYSAKFFVQFSKAFRHEAGLGSTWSKAETMATTVGVGESVYPQYTIVNSNSNQVCINLV
jgi:hypothetical protein